MGKSAADLLTLIRGSNKGDNNNLRIATVVTTEPDDITLTFEGTSLALYLDVFVIPVEMYPLRRGDKLLTLPIADNSTAWGAVAKITSGLAMGTMITADTLQIDGIDATFTADKLILPAGLTAGDRVSLAATEANGKIKYTVLNKY